MRYTPQLCARGSEEAPASPRRGSALGPAAIMRASGALIPDVAPALVLYK
jgi:hypothetical protein